MTYREIILKLLKNRKDIICLEDHLMSDFKNNNGGENFRDWCDNNGIEYSKLIEDDTPKLLLKIKEYNN
ncbi:MAG: hypothetical protein K0B37_04840 [Bacteroidales bacterium]|nr:hypothetical protein [Bacteroidales bacterium]